jgi:peroxidase
LQRDPLFPIDEKTNPVLCALPPVTPSWKVILSTAVEVVLEHIEAVVVEGGRWMKEARIRMVATRSEL